MVRDHNNRNLGVLKDFKEVTFPRDLADKSYSLEGSPDKTTPLLDYSPQIRFT